MPHEGWPGPGVPEQLGVKHHLALGGPARDFDGKRVHPQLFVAKSTPVL